MKKLSKRSSLACLYAYKLHVDSGRYLINVPLSWTSDINARMFFFCRMVFKTTQVALLFSDFLVVIVQ